MRRFFTVFVWTLLAAMPAQADVTRATDWLGRVVLTSEGELLGRVEDLAVNQSFAVEFVVVSVGSFLVEDNLIAVAPQALAASADGEYLTIDADTLASARRFDATSWPATAQVGRNTPATAPATAAAVPDLGSNRRGTATIVSDEKTATLSPEEAQPRIELQPPEFQPELASELPSPKQITEGIFNIDAQDEDFVRLDTNADNYLSRAEIGARLPPERLFNEYDLDGNGGLDHFEYRVLREDGSL